MQPRLLAGAAMLAALFPCQSAAAAGEPSNYLRCDGQPDNIGDGETAARVLGAVTLLGLFAPGNEVADPSQRRTGAEGVAACTAALTGEANDRRRAELILARAVHHIEANDFDAAVADARSVAADRPAFSGTPYFRMSFGLAAMDIEALALTARGRHAEAAAKAMEMADAAPYDVLNMLRAVRYVGANATFGEAERRFYDRAVRLYPIAVLDRAGARNFAGDWRGAAEDYALLSRVFASAIARPVASALGNAAIARALAGEGEAADALGREAQAAVDADAAAGRTAGVTAGREVIDLLRILRTFQNGNAAEARLLFAARSGWEAPHAAAVSEIARRLREGAADAQLTGLLAGDPARFRTASIELRRRNIFGGENAAKDYHRALRDYAGERAYGRFSGNVWREGRSRYFAREENKDNHARLVTVGRDGGGTPAGYALLLHSALVARAEGRSRFMLLPAQSAVYAAFVRTGNPGDERIVDQVSFDTEQVIADLSPLVPRAAAGAAARTGRSR
ncbi:MAG TPA: hypothetical protein VF552_09415 [Allosphingosinicella sp.]